MKQIKVLGPGCPRCEAVAQNAEAAVKNLGIDATIEKVSKKKGSMFRETPVLARIPEGRFSHSVPVLTKRGANSLPKREVIQGIDFAMQIP